MSDAAAERKRIAEMLEREAADLEELENDLRNPPGPGIIQDQDRRWLAYAQRRAAEVLRRIAKGLKEIDKED